MTMTSKRKFQTQTRNEKLALPLFEDPTEGNTQEAELDNEA